MNRYDNRGSENRRGLSAEERARLHEENSVRSRSNGNAERIKATAQRYVSSDRAKKKQTSSGNERSRNEKVKSSTRQRKKETKRQNNLLAVMLFVIAVALIGVISIFVLRVNAIEVINPEDRYSSAAVSDRAGIKEGSSMLLLNKKKAEAVIEKDFPYVEDVVIKRSWPDKITVELIYAVPAMAVDTGNGYIILNSDCKVLSADASTFAKPASLLKGVTVESAVPGETVVFSGEINTAALSELAHALEEAGFSGISCYDLTKISDIMIELDYRVEIKLGTLAGASEKLRFGKEVIARTAEKDTEHAMIVDLTTEGEAYVRVKNDNNVDYSVIPEETVTSDSTLDEENTAFVSDVPAVG